MSACLHVAVLCIQRSDGPYLFVQSMRPGTFEKYWHMPAVSCVTTNDALPDPDHIRHQIYVNYGTSLGALHPFLHYEGHCGDHTARYHIYHVSEYTGVISPPEGMIGYWENDKELRNNLNSIPFPILPSQAKALHAITLPTIIPITSTTHYGYDRMCEQAISAIHHGCSCLQIREKNLDRDQWTRFVKTILAEARRHHCLVILNDDLARIQTINNIEAIHLDSKTLHSLDKKPPYRWVSAACHHAEDHTKASELGLDAIFVSPVCESASHPGAPGIGYDALRSYTHKTTIPVFGLGGLSPRDVRAIQAIGGFGVAGIRQFWSSDTVVDSPGTV